MVTGVPQCQNCLPISRFFIGVVHTTGGVIQGYMHLANAPVFELLFEIHIQTCVTVDAQGNGWLTTDSQVYKCQAWIKGQVYLTAGDTACSVKGVFQHGNGASDLMLFVIPKTVETVSTRCDVYRDV